MPDQTLYEQLGGEAALRRIIDRFVDRVFDDVMIGYLFRAADRARVKQKEFEHAAEHLGAPIAYTGRPLAAVHAPHRVRSGQFMRRVQLLRETLAEFHAPAAVVDHFIGHTLSLRPLITDGDDGVCDPSVEQKPPAAAGKGVEK
jgi:truncated hemoglobin YjbI